MTQVVTLDKVCEFLDNRRKPVTAKDRKPGIYPYYGANGIQDHVDQYIFDDELVLLAEDGGFFDNPKRGVAYRVSGKCWVNNHAHVLKPKDIIDVDYLGLILRQYDVRPYITGAIVKKLNQSAARKMLIPLPSLTEQKEIVKTLLCAEKLQIKRNESINLLDEYLKSAFYEIFGDPNLNPNGYDRLSVQEVAKKVTDGEHITPIRKADGIKLLSARNIKNGYLDFRAGVDYIGEREYERIRKRCNPERGDVLISCSGTIGRVTTVEIDEPFTLVRSAALIKPNNNLILPKYLEYFLRTNYSQREMMKNVNQSSQANLFLGQIKKLSILLPPISNQQSFVNLFNSVYLIKQKMVLQASEMDNQFQALMQKAFN